MFGKDCQVVQTDCDRFEQNVSHGASSWEARYQTVQSIVTFHCRSVPNFVLSPQMEARSLNWTQIKAASRLPFQPSNIGSNIISLSKSDWRYVSRVNLGELSRCVLLSWIFHLRVRMVGFVCSMFGALTFHSQERSMSASPEILHPTVRRTWLFILWKARFFVLCDVDVR